MSTLPPPRVVWRFVDGKPGHEKQSAGLLQGLDTLCGIEVHEFDTRCKAMLWRQVQRHAAAVRSTGGAACAAGEEADIPRPHLLIGVGHRTHLPMLAARAACGGRSVALMKPTLPHRLFDLIFAPLHDRYRSKPNLVSTRGVICPAGAAAGAAGTAAAGAEEGSTRKAPNAGLVLLGGEGKHFDWRSTRVAAAIAAIAAAAPEVHWQVCDSRRTPPEMRAALAPAPNLVYRDWRGTAADFLANALARARYVWVTADSASMLYEALSAGARVGVIDLEPRDAAHGNKHQRGIEALRAEGHVTRSTDGLRLRGSGPAFVPENLRCARIVLQRLLPEALPSS